MLGIRAAETILASSTCYCTKRPDIWTQTIWSKHSLTHCKAGAVHIWGLEPLDALARHDLLEILEERYGRRSTIITSQLPVASWHEVIGDPTYADAILDRLVHNAHRIDLAGDSLRRIRPKSALRD